MYGTKPAKKRTPAKTESKLCISSPSIPQ